MLFVEKLIKLLQTDIVLKKDILFDSLKNFVMKKIAFL